MMATRRFIPDETFNCTLAVKRIAEETDPFVNRGYPHGFTDRNSFSRFIDAIYTSLEKIDRGAEVFTSCYSGELNLNWKEKNIFTVCSDFIYELAKRNRVEVGVDINNLETGKTTAISSGNFYKIGVDLKTTVLINSLTRNGVSFIVCRKSYFYRKNKNNFYFLKKNFGIIKM